MASEKSEKIALNQHIGVLAQAGAEFRTSGKRKLNQHIGVLAPPRTTSNTKKGNVLNRHLGELLLLFRDFPKVVEPALRGVAPVTTSKTRTFADFCGIENGRSYPLERTLLRDLARRVCCLGAVAICLVSRVLTEAFPPRRLNRPNTAPQLLPASPARKGRFPSASPWVFR